LNLTIEYKICYAEGSTVGMLIREVRLLTVLLMLYVAFVAIFAGVALCDQSGSSDVINLGSGPRPIYRIGYSGDGPVDIDELIEQAQSSSMNLVEGYDSRITSGQASETTSSLSSPSQEAPQFDSPAEPEDSSLSQDALKEDDGSDRSQIATVRSEAEEPPYVRVPIVSDPPGAEVYIDGMFYGVTPFIATVEPESHLVEVYLMGYWNWFNIVDFSESSRTIPITLTPGQPATLAMNETEAVQRVSVSKEVQPSIEANGTGNVTSTSVDGNDFWEENYRKFLIVVALLSFLIGSGSIATWARSRLTTSVKISFPRDGEDKWAGLVEGQSSRIRGTKKQVYVLVRYDDDHLQVRKRVEPNRDGRWSTRCEVEEGTVYRIYAVVVDRPLDEGTYLEEVPSHRAISEVGPVTGRWKAPKSAD
jgi:hypothetical protein